jgi:hypothetical protein
MNIRIEECTLVVCDIWPGHFIILPIKCQIVIGTVINSDCLGSREQAMQHK